jgi:hypothetical protein
MVKAPRQLFLIEPRWAGPQQRRKSGKNRQPGLWGEQKATDGNLNFHKILDLPGYETRKTPSPQAQNMAGGPEER